VRWLIRYGIGLLIWLPGRLNAQQVLYAESFHARASAYFQLIGKSEPYYWVEKLQRQKSYNHHLPQVTTELLSFGVLDPRLNLLGEYPATRLQGTLKQWLVCGRQGMDQMMVIHEPGKTKFICSHFQLNDIKSIQTRLIDSLPFSAEASSLLLVRSEDQSKILLLAFETTDSEPNRLHAMLFNSDWNPIYHVVLSDEQFAQPCIQDDEISFPAESFDNLPIKLADNGEWLMAGPSRISRNFSIFHAGPNGIHYYFREVPLSPFYRMEDIAMSVDNGRQEMSVGLLSAYANTTMKNVQVFNYSMQKGKFDFDSAYHFNTQYRDTRTKNLFHESFMAVPGAGYVLMLEYGKPKESDKQPVSEFNYWESTYLLTHYKEMNKDQEPVKNGYTLNSGLRPLPTVRNPGDLNLFYFPAVRKDSAWSGILDIEQHSDANNPFLSYLLVPTGNKLYMLYNHFDDYSEGLATTKTLNNQGQSTDEPMVFWQMDKLLNFQNARRFAANEVSVPFSEKQPTGFAVIRLK
jgi:hypothetical protein